MDSRARYSSAQGAAARAMLTSASMATLDAPDGPAVVDKVVPLSQSDVAALAAPLLGMLQQTPCVRVLGASTQVVVLDVNVPVSVAMEAAQETHASAMLLWEPATPRSPGCFSGILTLSDYISILVHCHANRDDVAAVAKMTIAELNNQPWRQDSATRPLCTAVATDSLHALLDMMERRGVSHVPILPEPLDGAGSPSGVIAIETLSNLLVHLARLATTEAPPSPNVPAPGPYPSLFEVPLCAMPGVGARLDARATLGAAAVLRPMDAVHAALDRLVTAGCNSLPIVDERGTIVDAFSRSDVIGLENFGVYDLTQTLQDALGSNRTPVPICQMTDTVGDIVAHFVATGAKDMFVVDAEHVFQGQISAEELLHFLYRSTLSR